MPDLNVNIGGNAAGLAAAVAEAQALLASLTDKVTCVYDIQVRGHQEAIKAFEDVAKARDAVGGATRIDIDTRDADRARGVVSGLGDDMDRARRQMDTFDRAGGGGVSSRIAQYEKLREATDKARAAHADLADAKRTHDLARSAALLGAPGETAAEKSAYATLMSSAERTEMDRAHAVWKQADDDAKGLRTTLRLTETAAGGAAKAVGSLGGNFQGLMGSWSGAGAAGVAAQIAGYATIGSGLLTAGVGALGAGSALAVGGMGGLLGAGAAGLTGFTLDTLGGKGGRMEAELKQLGNAYNDLVQDAVEPYGRSLAKIGEQGLKAATPEAMAPVTRAMTEIGATAEAMAPKVGEAMGILGRSFEQVTSNSAPAFLAFAQNLPGLTAAITGPVEQLTAQFGAMAGAVFDEGVPAFARLTTAAGNLGSEILSIGGDTFAPFLDDVTSMTDGATGMMRKLEPAIRPAMSAVTAGVTALEGALGNTAPQTQQWAENFIKNAPKIQTAAEGVVKGMTGLGESGVDAVAGGSSAIDRLGESFQKNKGVLGDLGGDLITIASDALTTVMDTLVGNTGMGSSAGAKQRKEFGEAWDWLTGRTPVEEAPAPAGLDSVTSAPAPGRALTGRHAGPLSQDIPDSLRQELGLPPAPDTPGAFPTVQPQPPAGPSGGLTGPLPLPGGPQVPFSTAPTPGAPGTFPTVQPPPIPLGGPTVPGGAPVPAPPAQGDFPRVVPDLPTAPMPALGGLFTGALQSAQQAGAQIPQAMQQGMVQAPPIVGPPPQSFGGLFTGALQQAQQAGTQVPQVMEQAVQQAPPPAIQAAPLQRAIESAAPQAEAGGQTLGQAITGGTVQGITTTETVIDTVIRRHVKRIIDVYEDSLDAHSPSRRIAAISVSIPQGTAVGIQAGTPVALSAMSGMADAVAGTAMESWGRHQVGQTWARSVLTGFEQTFATDQLKAITAPKIDNRLAKATLGAMGALGPAGAGALVAKTYQPNTRTIGDGGGSGTQTIVLKGAPVMLNGEQIATIADQRVTVKLGQLADSYARQSG